MIALAGGGLFYAALQSQQLSAKLPQFETVSIKPNDSDRVGSSGFLPDGYRGENVSLTPVILGAYGLERRYQILGLPKWAKTAHYEIVAKVGEADLPMLKTLGYSKRYKMLQPVLADRFSLRCHWEKRSLPAYTLQISGKDVRLEDVTSADQSKTVTVGEATIGAGTFMKMANGRVIARAVTIAQLVSMLEDELDKHVVDATGLKGKYDFEMQLPPGPDRSSFAAGDNGGFMGSADRIETDDLIEDGLSQIGLKLAPVKAELPVLMIDELKPPSPN